MVQWSADDMPSVKGDGSDCEAWKKRWGGTGEEGV